MGRLEGDDVDGQGPMLIVPLQQPAETGQTCRASGWGTLRGSTDGDQIVCPICGQNVVATQDPPMGPAVRVIGEHDA